MCNLGRLHPNKTSISSIYSHKDGELTADKAFDGNYFNYFGECAGTKENGNTHNEKAWWEVTFRSISTIFKINLIFREECKFSWICMSFKEGNIFGRITPKSCDTGLVRIHHDHINRTK